jgi:hypothetical protein
MYGWVVLTLRQLRLPAKLHVSAMGAEVARMSSERKLSTFSKDLYDDMRQLASKVYLLHVRADGSRSIT